MSISYIIHVAILISIFFVTYQILLSKTTFFNLNRFVLIFGIFACFLLPFIPAPAKIAFGGTHIESNVNIKESLKDIITESPTNITSEDESNTSLLSPQITIIESEQRKFILGFLPMIYLLGVLILLVNLIIQFFNIGYKIIKYRKTGSNIISLPTPASPCSFFGFTLISNDLKEPILRQHVLSHEKIHNAQLHSLDIILAELMVVLQWFNPFAWQYRKTVETNLEYIADSSLIDQKVEKKKYQYNLLQLAVPNFPLSIVTNYNQTLIKKRITMMNTKQSSTRIGWKYLLYLPIIMFSITLLNPTTLSGLNTLVEPPQKLILLLTSNTSKSDLQRIQSEARQFGYSLVINDTKWKDENTLKEISFNLYFDSEGSISQKNLLHDLNRFNSFFVYKINKGNQGGIVGLEITSENIKSLIPDSNIEESNYVVLASFLDSPIPLNKFIDSNLLDSNNQIFKKEKKWFTLFENDARNNANKNLYTINGTKVEIAEAKKAFTQAEILDVKVDELDNDKVQFNFLTKSKSGYHPEANYSIAMPSNHPTKYLSEFNEILKEQLDEFKLKEPKYYLDGIETNMTMITLDTTLVKQIVIENGNNFDEGGNHISKEVRVLFKSI